MNNYINQQLSQSIIRISVLESKKHTHQIKVEKSIKVKISNKYFED